MKYLALLLLTFACLQSFGQENYILTIEGKEYNIGLDKKIKVKINGEDQEIQLKQKATFTFDHPKFSFSYPSEFSVSRSKIDKDIEQIIVMNSVGTGVLIQVYGTVDPTLFKSLLLNEVIKESMNYGFEKTSKETKRKVKSGQTLEVEKVSLDYKDEKNVYEIASYSSDRDEGIIILTINTMADDTQFDGSELIETIWKSLTLKD